VNKAAFFPWRPCGRWILLHPAFITAALVTLYLLVCPPEPRILPDDSPGPVDLAGYIRTLPEIREDHVYFEVTPIESSLRGEPFETHGRVGVWVRSSLAEPADYFDPPLRVAERVVLRTHLTAPTHYLVPGVTDARRQAFARGRYFRASLKSPALLDRLGPELGAFPQLLRWTGSYLEQFRGYCRASLDPLTASWVEALVLSLGSSLPPEEWQRAAETGLIHLFVVSGLHVSVILGTCHLLLRRLGPVGPLLSVAGVWAYIALLGFPPPATRAAAMISLGYAARQLGVGSGGLNGLGVAAILVIGMHPAVAGSRSFHFTFAGVTALLLLAAPAVRAAAALLGGVRDAGSDRLTTGQDSNSVRRRWLRFQVEARLCFIPELLRFLKWTTRPLLYLSGLALASGSIFVFLFPLTLHHTNYATYLSAAANLIVLPFFTLFLPAAFALLALHPLPPAGLLCPLLDQMALLFDRMLHLAETLPGTWSAAHPDFPETLLYYTLLLLLLWRLTGPRRLLVVALPVLLVLLITTASPPEDRNGTLTITLLDVGQGDAIHVAYPDGSDAFFDIGGSRFEAVNHLLARRVIARYLWSRRVRGLDFVVLSHPESDHSGTLPFLARAVPINSILCFDPPGIIAAPVVQLQAGLQFIHGRTAHTVLYPDIDNAPRDSPNDRSLVLLLEFGDFSFLFTGDAGTDVERRLADQIRPITILKIAHHGSLTSSSIRFLRAVQPVAAVISAGRRNPFGHPHPRVLERLEREGVPAFSTASLGSLRISTDGRQVGLSRFAGEERFEELLAFTLPRALPAD
jgi:competence protein ComEC